LIAVYAPIGLQGGLTGSLFREFAFTLAGAVTISGVVALTLSPMMASKLLSAEDEEHWLPAHDQRRTLSLKRLLRPPAGRRPERNARRLIWSGARPGAAGGADVDVLRRRNWRPRGSGGHLRHRRRRPTPRSIRPATFAAAANRRF
jgi:hypothetical protein